MTQFEYAEGATPVQDYSYFKLAWIQTQKDLNRAEAENIAAAQKKYLNKPTYTPLKWLELTTLKKIHKEMYENVWEWAGKYRKEVTSIGIKPYMIPSRLAELCSEVKYWLTNPVELSFLEQAARIHHKMVSIHPFENGNGRFSRLIADRFKCADWGDYDLLITFMRSLGAKEPLLSELLTSAIYQNKLTNSQKLAMVKAFLRIGHQINKIKNNGHYPLHIAIKKEYHSFASYPS